MGSPRGETRLTGDYSREGGRTAGGGYVEVKHPGGENGDWAMRGRLCDHADFVGIGKAASCARVLE